MKMLRKHGFIETATAALTLTNLSHAKHRPASGQDGACTGWQFFHIKRATTAGRQARAGENVPRTARPGLVACRWRSA